MIKNGDGERQPSLSNKTIRPYSAHPTPTRLPRLILLPLFNYLDEEPPVVAGYRTEVTRYKYTFNVLVMVAMNRYQLIGSSAEEVGPAGH